MAQLLKGAPVAAAILSEAAKRAEALRNKGIVPTLAILRVGEREEDIAYENGAAKKCAGAGVEVKKISLPADVAPEVFYATLSDLSSDASLHGILMFRPLPEHLDARRAFRLIAHEKDVDGCTDGSFAGVFSDTESGFAPCTAVAILRILSFYGIDPAGKHAVVLGRSLTVGRPTALLLMHKNATVSICHSKTPRLEAIAREADILVVAIGRRERITGAFLSPGQTVIDVGIHLNEKTQKLCGDVLFEEADPLVSALTPVPGGVGAVTSAVLALHTVEAAERQCTAR